MSTTNHSTPKRGFRKHTSCDSPLASPAIPEQGKHIVWDRISRDWYSFYNGNFLGSRAHRHEAERLADDAAYADARQSAYAEGFRAGMNAAR